MGCRKYLLSISELWEGTDGSSAEELQELVCTKLDRKRLEKLQNINPERGRIQCMGAGLLLQMGLQEAEQTLATGVINGADVTAEDEDAPIQKLTVSEVLDRLRGPIEPIYTYGPKGKPFLKDLPLFFNLSHSEEYVFCVFSDQEVGVDIQYCKPGNHDRIVNRYFTAAERTAWECCQDPKEQEELFYRIWTRKEAYGKLTGRGITDALAVDVMKQDGLIWEEYQVDNNYRAAICLFGGEKE